MGSISDAIGGFIAPATNIAGDIFGGISGATAAGKAAQQAAGIQAGAAQAGIAEQRRQFDKMVELMSPYVGAGSEALQQQKALLGMGGTGPTYETYDLSPEEIRAAKLQKMGITEESLASKSPMIRSLFEQGISQQNVPTTGTRMISPGISAEEAQRQAVAGIAGSPMFQQLAQQGETAMLQQAAATGGLRGGNLQAGLAQFRPQMLNELISQQYQRLGGLTSLGQASAAGQAGGGMQSAANIGNLLGQQAAAQAGGVMAPAQMRMQSFGDMLSLGGTLAKLF